MLLPSIEFLGEIEPINEAPGSKLALGMIIGPLGPSILIGFMLAQTPLGWR
jgi:hypothetical protein